MMKFSSGFVDKTSIYIIFSHTMVMGAAFENKNSISKGSFINI